MSANAGSVKASLEGDATSFIKSMQQGAQEVEKLSKHMKKLAQDFAMNGVAITAAALGAMKAVSEFNGGAKRSLQNFTDAGLSLANQFAGMVKPAVDELAMSVRQLADWFAGLSPHTRAQIGHFVKLAVEVGAAALVFGRLMSVVNAIAGAFSTVLSIVAAIGAGPLALIVTGIAAIIGIVYVLHKAWQQNWGGIQEIVKNVIDTISGWWSQFAGFLGDLWGGIVNDIASKAKAMVAIFLQIQQMRGALTPQQAGFAGMGLNAGIGEAAKIATSKSAVGQLVLEAANVVKSGAGAVVGDLVDMAKKAKGEVLKYLGLESEGGHARQIHTRPNKNALPEAYSEGIAQAIIHALDTYKKPRIDPTGGPNGGPGATGGNNTTPVPKTLSDLMEDYAKEITEAWDAGDLPGALRGVGKAIVEDLTNIESIVGGIKVAGNALASHLGKLGDTINAGVQGFQAGGPWGALAAVLLEFVTQAKGWAQIMDIGNGQFQMALNDMASGISDFIGGFRMLMGGIESIAHSVHQVLSPVLSLLGTILQGIAPIFEFVGIALRPLGPIVKVISDILGTVLKPVLQAVGWVLTGLAESFLGTENVVLLLWQGILKFVRWVTTLFSGDTSGIDAMMSANQANIDSIQQQMKDLWDHGLAGLADSSANAAEQLGKTATAAAAVTQQLLNVPEGFKVALAEFNATQAVGTSSTGGMTGGTYVAPPPPARQRFLKMGNPVPLGLFPRTKP